MPTDSEELNQRWRCGVENAETDRSALIERDRQLWAALDEQTLSGELRRAIFENLLSTGEIAERATMPLGALNGFLFGESPLDSEAFNRIAQVLDCHLVSSA